MYTRYMHNRQLCFPQRQYIYTRVYIYLLLVGIIIWLVLDNKNRRSGPKNEKYHVIDIDPKKLKE